jgi:hypothetical protein
MVKGGVMSPEIVRVLPVLLRPVGLSGAGEERRWRFLEFFTANISNKNTRLVSLRAILPFLTWCEARGLWDLRDIRPIVIAAYIE